MPFSWDTSSLFLQQLVNGLTLGGIYALVAVGYTMVYGVLELINFAHGEVYMLGAYVAWYAVSAWHLPFPAALVLGVALGALLGLLLERVAYRPLRRAPRLAALITAIGMSIFLQNLALLAWGAQIRGFPPERLPGFFAREALRLGEVGVSWLQLTILGLSLGLMALLHRLIHGTRVGAAMRALAQDRPAAALMGIDVDRVVALTFALGSALGAAAGVLVGVFYNAIWPTMGHTAGIKAFAAAVLGGIGSVPGAMLGGVVLGVAEVFGAGYLSSAYRDGIAYGVMILVIVFKPAGLLGRALPAKV